MFNNYILKAKLTNQFIDARRQEGIVFKKGRIVLLCGLMVFLIACNCNLLNLIKGAVPDAEGDSTTGGGSSPFSLGGSNNQSPNTKKYDGEITILDQATSRLGDQFQFALLVENTSQKLTVSGFILEGSVKDASGAELPLLNLNDGTSKDFPTSDVIYPGQKGLICLSYELPVGSTVGDYSFKFKEITSMDMGLKNPLVAESKNLDTNTNLKYRDYYAYVTGMVRNTSTTDILHPEYRAGLFDTSGKLIGCGTQDERFNFIPAGAVQPAGISVWTSDQNVSNYEIYSSPEPDYGVQYSGPEPIKVSDVGFIQEGVYVYPVYTLTNTLSKEGITQFLVNLIAYDANNNMLVKSSYVTEGIPPGMSVGPYHDQLGQVGESEVSRIEVQVHTTEIKALKTPITADSVVFSPGVFVPGEYKITTTATNNTNAELNGYVQAACLDASGKVTGLAQASFDLPAKSDTPLELSGGYVGFYETGPNCSPEDKIVFNLLKIYEW
jgi:hypothetical protein